MTKTLLKTIPTSRLNARAKGLLLLFKDYTNLGKEIEQDKDFFRTEADGEGLTEIVQGLGQVKVNKPAAADKGTSLTFDVAAWALLDSKTQELLLKKGVVKKTEWTRAEGTASVTITLNK